MGIQNTRKRNKFSQLRQRLMQLVEELRQLVGPFMSDKPVVAGSVYELKRKCGKPTCKCALKGELHGRMVVSAKEGGKTKLTVIPKGSLVDVSQKTERYRSLRQNRARLVAVHRELLGVIDEMVELRREEVK